MPNLVHPSLDDARLSHLADSLGRAIADNGGGVLVHVTVHRKGPDIGILPLDGLAPADVLLGTYAPKDWAVLGVATQGWARPLDGPGDRVRAEVVVLVARDGRVVSRVRYGDQVIEEPPALGVTLDCLLRALGLPTAPADETRVDWGQLRQLVATGGWPALGLTAEEAAWFDDGSFSRWVMSSQRPLPYAVTKKQCLCALERGRPRPEHPARLSEESGRPPAGPPSREADSAAAPGRRPGT